MERSPVRQEPSGLRWRALWLALGWALAAAIVWLSLTPSPPKIYVEQGDKLGHFTAYCALMFWFCQLYPARRTRIGYALGLIAMGIAIEFIQRATGYRSLELWDMVADTAGVLVGWLLAVPAGHGLPARLEAAISRWL